MTNRTPWVTFDKTDRTYDRLGDRVTDVAADHDPTDLQSAMALAMHPEPLALRWALLAGAPSLRTLWNHAHNRHTGGTGAGTNNL